MKWTLGEYRDLKSLCSQVGKDQKAAALASEHGNIYIYIHIDVYTQYNPYII